MDQPGELGQRSGMEAGERGRAPVVPALVMAVTAISFAAIFFRKAAPTHPLVMAGVRLTIATILLSPSVWLARRGGRLPNRIVRSAIWGGVAYAVHFGTWVTSLTLTTVAASVTLVTATPLILAVVGAISKRDAPTQRHMVAMGIAGVGLLVVGGADVTRPEALAGDALALVGAAAMAVYMLLARRHGDDLDSWAFSGVATFVGAALLLGTAGVVGVPIAFTSWEPFGLIVLAALFPQLVGHGLVTWSLRYVRPTVVAIATLAEPVGSSLLAWLWLDERVEPVTLVGCAITLLGVALAVWRPAPRTVVDP